MRDWGLDGAGRPITRERVRAELFWLDHQMLEHGHSGLAGALCWAVFEPQLAELGLSREFLLLYGEFALVDTEAKAEYVKAEEALGVDKPSAPAALQAIACQTYERMLARCP